MQDADLSLLRAWAEGDAAAGDAFIRRYGPTLWRYFSNKLSGEVEDAIQATFLACVQHRDRLTEARSVRAYVLSIARHHLGETVRRRGLVSPHISSIASTEPSPSSNLHRRRRADQLRAALRELPLVYQEVLELYYWEGLRGAGLTEALGVADGTSRSRLRRARAALHRRLANELDTASADARDG